LVALKAGDPALFEDFVSAESSTFLAFYRRLGVGPSAAEDLVQEVFLKLFRHAASYQPSGRFTAFAFRIARNAWIDASRRGAQRARQEGAALDGGGQELPALQVPASAPSPLELAQVREEAGRVSQALQELSQGQRLVFELGVVQELAYSEIARLLEIPEGTVKSRMFHAVRKLRKMLEQDPPGQTFEGVARKRARS